MFMWLRFLSLWRNAHYRGGVNSSRPGACRATMTDRPAWRFLLSGCHRSAAYHPRDRATAAVLYGTTSADRTSCEMRVAMLAIPLVFTLHLHGPDSSSTGWSCLPCPWGVTLGSPVPDGRGCRRETLRRSTGSSRAKRRGAATSSCSRCDERGPWLPTNTPSRACSSTRSPTNSHRSRDWLQRQSARSACEVRALIIADWSSPSRAPSSLDSRPRAPGRLRPGHRRRHDLVVSRRRGCYLRSMTFLPAELADHDPRFGGRICARRWGYGPSASGRPPFLRWPDVTSALIMVIAPSCHSCSPGWIHRRTHHQDLLRVETRITSVNEACEVDGHTQSRNLSGALGRRIIPLPCRSTSRAPQHHTRFRPGL